jgi:hypothetical protein
MKTWDQQLAWFRKRHPKIGETEAMARIAEGYRSLNGEYRWPWLIAHTVITTEASFTDGTVSVTNNSVVITPTGAWDTTWKHRRIMISGRSEVYGLTYNTGTSQWNLSQAWPGDNGSGLSYTVFRSEYAMPADCDYGRDVIFVDAQNRLQFPMVSAYDLKTAAAYRYGEVSYPEAVARVQLEVITGVAYQLVEFFPAPAGVYSFPAYYFKKPAGPTLGSDVPFWPEDYEDLIGRHAEILLSQDPSHRVVLSPETKQIYMSRLWDLKKRGDGGAEIQRRIQLYHEGGWGLFFQNMNFTSTGINPLVGG